MKLATLRNGTRDGMLVVVNRDLDRMTLASGIAPTLQAALDDWAAIEPALRELSDRLERRQVVGAMPFIASDLAAPLPRAFGWIV